MDIEKYITDLLDNKAIIKDKGEFTLYQYSNRPNYVALAYIKENNGNRSTLVYNVNIPISKNDSDIIKKTFQKITGFHVDNITSSPDDFGQMKHFLQIK